MKNLWFLLKEDIAKNLKVDIEEIEEPEKYGDFAYPCFNLAKKSKKKPNEIAKELAEKLKVKFLDAKAVGPYVNFYIRWEGFGQILLEKINKSYGGSLVKGKKALIEHTSINPNASPHVGRVRNAIIGDTLVRLLKFIGYETEVHYFVNDVGKQIAILVFGVLNEKIDIEKLKFKDILDLYIKTSKSVEEDPELEKKVFNLLSRFEGGDKKTIDLFKKVVSLCIDGQIRIMSSLGINYDYFDYESKYIFNKKTNELIKRFEKTGKIFVDEGRKILDLKDFDIPMESPALVLARSDDTSLYVLRDIAYTIEKIERAKDLNIVVLGEDHRLYFKQISAALKILGYEPPKVVHYSFILLPSGKMSTRRGNLVLLEDFMEKTLEKAMEEIDKRYNDLPKKEKEARAKKIAVGAVRYSVIKVGNDKNVNFTWDEALRFEGNTGPYLQYTYARANSILEKADLKSFEASLLKDDIEKNVLKLLSKYPTILETALNELKPYLIANYLHEIANEFNNFYQTLPVLKAEKGLREARLKLVDSVKTVLENGLNLLGIPVMDKM
jgi:arginyl-tRNA synthetase